MDWIEQVFLVFFYCHRVIVGNMAHSIADRLLKTHKSCYHLDLESSKDYLLCLCDNIAQQFKKKKKKAPKIWEIPNNV